MDSRSQGLNLQLTNALIELLRLLKALVDFPVQLIPQESRPSGNHARTEAKNEGNSAFGKTKPIKAILCKCHAHKRKMANLAPGKRNPFRYPKALMFKKHANFSHSTNNCLNEFG
ncbi:hypothetical protein B4W69_07075 [Staphylococcus delphini]|nr:hypothetical protein B4W69_07075 [Staphylococcus delphini]